MKACHPILVDKAHSRDAFRIELKVEGWMLYFLLSMMSNRGFRIIASKIADSQHKIRDFFADQR
jgi:hypothetical protein